jgi:hypothetical protein
MAIAPVKTAISRTRKFSRLASPGITVFGPAWEAGLAKQIGAPLVEIAYPATDEVVLWRSYVGYRGALE